MESCSQFQSLRENRFRQGRTIQGYQDVRKFPRRCFLGAGRTDEQNWCCGRVQHLFRYAAVEEMLQPRTPMGRYRDEITVLTLSQVHQLRSSITHEYCGRHIDAGPGQPATHFLKVGLRLRLCAFGERLPGGEAVAHGQVLCNVYNMR